MSVRERMIESRPGIGARLLPDFAGPLVRMLTRGLRHGRLVVVTPAGSRVERQGALDGPEATISIANIRALRRVLTGGATGFAEGYIAGDWSSPNLPALIELLALNEESLGSPAEGFFASRLRRRLEHRGRRNTREGSRRNISFHYDLGNDFYERWLDRGMQYSSAIRADGDTLETAQQRKLDRIVDLLDLAGGERVLEIGCGWGAVAERLAAEKSCAVTGVTLSTEQLSYARARLAGAALLADLRLQDYRDVDGVFDRIVSVEMIEAVGEEYWPSYFETLWRRLAPGGKAVIQSILIDENRFEAYRRNPDFIQTYIFPGGMLPTPAMLKAQARAAGLVLAHEELHGASYAWTLAEWRTRFHAAWPQIEKMKFDTRFRRLWDYYLAYCEGGFRAGAIDVGIYVLEKPAA
ncbi:cyclopropane-fatty-acyl-phospholipid synthase [Kaistia geumhonensis]|uniref:Cyclopropane-fatty-acyl-phospholipid synthase n=1 Tax=Kaistia geumhonensis TaxID=410839 RepID=A0ABU0M217_9HYPH|nr:cyclopropane-fatty-acyl-phospholipid synthase family protein [Kaistia geumhonensis]MCX5479792.1 cyclopropane-fatty-acyl-phospholipid synthase [Kaistia geumhonensis]MDQ0514983.1 cyclopropane-fatty-acyl-phospholipid synthase [Kaistia geumhonensis]